MIISILSLFFSFHRRQCPWPTRFFFRGLDRVGYGILLAIVIRRGVLKYHRGGMERGIPMH